MIVNGLARCRHRLGWSQRELAECSGLSRTEISAIETNRVVPSTAAALSLARALECSVEELFSLAEMDLKGAKWAWKPTQTVGRFWQSRVGGKILLFPTEWIPSNTLCHHGFYENNRISLNRPCDPNQILVIAGCDPAVGLVAAHMESVSSFRVLPLIRSSGKALELMEKGLVHVAGFHFSDGSIQDKNSVIAKKLLGEKYRLLRVARWEEGVVVDPLLKVDSIGSALGSNLRWVGREEGSGARECLDQVLCGHSKPEGYQYQALDHHGVAEIISTGWAQAGVCIRLSAEERGLRFLKVREENYDLCFSSAEESDPRIQTLLAVVSSASYREDLEQLPGYHTVSTGNLQ